MKRDDMPEWAKLLDALMKQAVEDYKIEDARMEEQFKRAREYYRRRQENAR